MLNKILVAIDGSEHAEKALDFALYLADEFSSKITLLTVIEYKHVPLGLAMCVGISGYTAELIDESLQLNREHHREILNKALNRAIKLKPNVEIKGEIIEGTPSDAILNVAKGVVISICFQR